MKFVMLFLVSLVSLSSFATVDGHDRVFLVVRNIQSDDFLLERAPIIGCYGLAQGARLQQWTSEYKVPVNIGCGGTPSLENINALSCAKVVDTKESSDYSAFAEISLDISKCPDKDNARFLTLVRTSAVKNFPQPNKHTQVRLVIKK